jgi:hypothetical protein
MQLAQRATPGFAPLHVGARVSSPVSPGHAHARARPGMFTER